MQKYDIFCMNGSKLSDYMLKCSYYINWSRKNRINFLLWTSFQEVSQVFMIHSVAFGSSIVRLKQTCEPFAFNHTPVRDSLSKQCRRRHCQLIRLSIYQRRYKNSNAPASKT